MIYYEIKVAYERQTGEDNPAKARETYLLEGINCSDVEGRLMTELMPYAMGNEIEVTSCKKTQWYDIIAHPSGDTWYKCRVELITVEDDGQETRKTVSILIQASTISEALKNATGALSNLDCEIVSIQRSPIMEVYRAVQ